MCGPMNTQKAILVFYSIVLMFDHFYFVDFLLAFSKELLYAAFGPLLGGKYLCRF